MTRIGLARISAALILAMAVVAVVLAARLPADARLPVHWGLSGPDRFAGKWTALLLPLGITAFTSVIFYALPRLEPRAGNLERSQGLYLWAWVATLPIGPAVQLAAASLALHWRVAPMHLLMGAMGLALALIGNQLGKSRSMYLIGIRTPWTLASEEVWIKTHRLAGKLMVAAGLALLLVSFLPIPSGPFAALCAGLVLVSTLVPTIYSYFAWRREQHSGQVSG
jgi:uncharacterized membrane protein